MPSRCRIPWTTRSATSSSYVPAWFGAFRCATAGQMTTSPSNTGRSAGSAGREPGPVPPESGERPPSTGSSSMGKASTSVGPPLPRKRRFKSVMAPSSTKSTDSSASPLTPSALSTFSASRTHRMVSTGMSVCSSAAKTSITMSPGGTLGPLVGTHDVLDNAVAHHVAVGKPHERQSVDPAEDLLQPDEAGPAPGQVDLGHVTSHHRPAAETDAGQEHLHLLGRGVLRLVENDEAVVQRPSTHERERGHFDRALGHQVLATVRTKHVEQGVVERAQVG